MIQVIVFALSLQATPPSAADRPATHSSPAAIQTSPGPLQPIGGILGFTSLSEVVFDSQPDLPHRFEANYAFPARVRWWLSHGDPEAGNRHADYRFGSTLYRLSFGQETSVEYEVGERNAVVRRMELRRAVMLWPDGFAWEDDADGWRAPITGAAGEVIGEIHGSRDDGPRPAAFTAFDVAGNEQESLVILGWREEAKRWWPARLRLTSGGQVVWTETIERVDTRRRYLDAFYLPVDRRPEGRASKPFSVIEVRTMEVPLLRVRRFELPLGVDWKRAQEIAVDALAAEDDRLADRGLALDGVARFEVDGNGDPTSLLFTLDGASRTPSDFEPLDGRTGLFVVLDDVSELSRSIVDELLAAVPDGARPLPAYVRRVGDRSSKQVQVVLPLIPEDG